MPEPLIVLTGAAGQLGSTVRRALAGRGMNLRATDRVSIDAAGRSLIRANLDGLDDCRRIVQGAQVLVHLAYNRRPDESTKGHTFQTFDEHIRMNRQLFLAACEAGVKKIIYSSSIQVVARQHPAASASQPPDTLPLDENSRTMPDNWYGLAKLCSEEMLAMLRREFGVDYVILRFPMLVHSVPFAHPEHLQSRLAEAFSYLTMRDAADLIFKVLDANLPGGRIYLPASRHNTQSLPVREIIQKYCAGIPLRKPVDEMEGLVDLATLHRDLGWEPQDLCQSEIEPSRPTKRSLRERIVRRLPVSKKFLSR